jgi:hypothetical protein
MTESIFVPARPKSAKALPLQGGRFHVPFEHGAWWAFGSVWVGALAVALFRHADFMACLCAALALAIGFVVQDWAQALVGVLLGRRSQARSRWQAPQGWFLSSLALAALGVQVFRCLPSERWAWLGLWMFLSLAMGLGLLVRVLQSGRGRQSLAGTALLLAVPALPLGVLAFGFGWKVLALFFWPLVYYPAATLAAQSYIRGFPEKARWAGPALAAGMGFLALFFGAWLAGLLLALNAGRWGLGIRWRWRTQPQGMPPIAAIRSFGRIQAAFGVILTLVWVWVFARL